MITQLRAIIDSINNKVADIHFLLAAKIKSLSNQIKKCDVKDYFSLLQISDLFGIISKEIENDINILAKLETILKLIDDHLYDLLNSVPHYDNVTVLPDTEDEEEDDENFEPYSQLYLDNLLMNVTDEELVSFTSDNGKLVYACRTFIPPSTICLNTLLTTLTELEMCLDNDDLNHHSLYQCNGTLNAFNMHFNTFVDQLTI